MVDLYLAQAKSFKRWELEIIAMIINAETLPC
jgi:hypothetical protein